MASYQYIYIMKNLSKVYPGGKKVLNDIWLSFFPGAKIGIIGTNGAGKSTLLKIMAGLDNEFTGEAWAADGVKVGFLPQDPKLDDSKNVYDNILEGVKEKQSLLDKFQEISMKFCEVTDDEEMNKLLEEQAKLQEQIDACDAWNIEREIEMAMEALRCPEKDSPVNNLSGGEKRRIALCRLLLSKPDLLLLDEPTNHLDAESVAWLENYMKNYTGTVVLVTHDRYFLDNVTGWILELDNGDGIPWEGNYSSWLEQKDKRLAQEKKTDDAKRKTLQSELEWVRQSPKARQSKSKARLNAYNKLLEENNNKDRRNAQIIIPDGPRLGNNVIDFKNVTKSYGDRVLIDNLTLSIEPGAIIGIIGPNGVGKTTLFKMIAGIENPNEGEIEIGESVKIAYVDQIRESLNAEKTVWEEISEGQEELQLGKHSMKSRAYCSAFNFRGVDQQKKIGFLSGGELNRVNLAKLLKQGANVIMLDEPTNDLDVDTLRALEEAIYDFAGCILVTSHDRWFLDRIATHILSFEGDSKVEWFPGNFAEYEEYKINKYGKDALTPKRVKYKKLMN